MKTIIFSTCLFTSLLVISNTVIAKTVQQIENQQKACISNSTYAQQTFNCIHDATMHYQKMIKSDQQKKTLIKGQNACNKKYGKPNIEKQANVEYSYSLSCYMRAAKSAVSAK